MKYDRSLGVTIYQEQGTLITECITDGPLPTTAGRFSAGCIMIHRGYGRVYRNSGTAELPVWSSLTGDSHNIVTAGEHTTAGGSAEETIEVPGVLASDVVFVMMKTEGASPVTILAAAVDDDEIAVTFSDDPDDDHVIAYQVLRAL